MESEKPTKPVQAMQMAGGPGGMRQMMGHLMVDNAIRQAIQHCWMVLPEEERTVDRVEQEIRRLVDRALADLKEDSAAFHYGAGAGD